MINIETQRHWDAVYEGSETEQLGWFENNPEPSINLIQKCKLPKTARILHAGAGATSLVDILIEKGFKNQIVTDVSAVGLRKLRQRLGFEKSGKVEWILDDLTKPFQLNAIAPVDLWHDRAVLHFFTEEKEQQIYFDLVHKLVKSDGFVIIAAYNLEGAKTCSGLPVKNYNAEMIAEKLDGDFQLLETFDYRFIMPSGEERPYVYTLFRRGE
jgi:EEF1A lysine methyltransferase 2